VASLTKKVINGKSYYYLRECQRVDGKPKIVWTYYLGSAERLVERITRPDTETIEICEFGASAACFDIATALDVVSIIDRHVPKRGSARPSVGDYLLLAALNRCVAPCSKARLSEWYAQSFVRRLIPASPSQLTSQRFWDNMNRVDEDQLRAIERDICRNAVSRFGLDLRCLLFDATNFFTFVDSFNEAPELPQRGHSKEGRDNLRIVGLALLVTSDGDVPLFHHTYAGNQHDSVTFQSVSDELVRRCQDLAGGVSDITLVFDKGNNSQDNMSLVADARMHFIGSLVPTHHPELLGIVRTQMRRLDTTQLPAVWSYRTKKTVFGVERTVLVTFNRPLFLAQVKTLRREINKRRRKLDLFQAALERSASKAGGKKASLAGARKRLASIVTGRHMKDLFVSSVELGTHGLPMLNWRFADVAWKSLQTTLLGKTILFTNRDDWQDEQIVRGYRAQSHVESAFRGMKDPHYLSFRPVHHWTDQKLRVHALYCVMALMILNLLRRKLKQSDIPVSLARMVERLADIREVGILFNENDVQSPRLRTVLSDIDPEQKKMFAALDLARFRTE